MSQNKPNSPGPNFQIVQHNYVSNSRIFHSLFSELARTQPEMVCIQDLPLFNNIPLAAPGHSVVFLPRGARGKVKVAMFISKNLSKTSFLPVFFDRDNIMAVSLFMEGPPTEQQCLERLLVVNIYNHKEKSSHCITPDKIFQDAPRIPTLVIRDFNIHNPITDPSRSFNKNEISESSPYFQLASELGFIYINHPGTHTR